MKRIIIFALTISFVLLTSSCSSVDTPDTTSQINNQEILSPHTQNTFATEKASYITEQSNNIPPEPTESIAGDADKLYKPAVLMYHLIMEEPYNNLEALFVRPNDFRSHIEILQTEGYDFLFADSYNESVTPSVILTFDDGYEDNYTTMFPIIKEYNVKATVFLITDMIGTPGYMTKEQIKEMADSGLVQFGCHTASHCDLTLQTEERIRSEFTESTAIIEEITGMPCKILAYPAGGHNPTVIIIADEFFDYAYISRPIIPDGIETNMKIPRYYISRGMGPNNVLNTIRP